MAGIFPNSGVAASAATNTVANPNVVAGCTPLFASTSRCQPRFDPAAFNAVISEMLNLVNCGGTAYDCNKLDNLCVAMRKMIADAIAGADISDKVNDVLFDCLEREFPLAQGCTIVPLALSTDAAGCTRIARYNQTASEVGTFDVTGARGPGFGPAPIPSNIGDPNSYYFQAQLVQDQLNNVVNEAKAQQSLVACGLLDIDCAGVFDIDVVGGINFNPTQNAPNGAIGTLAVRIDGEFILQGASNELLRFRDYTNFEGDYAASLRFPLSAGQHTICIYAIGSGAGNQAAQVSAFSTPDGRSNWRGTVRRAF